MKNTATATVRAAIYEVTKEVPDMQYSDVLRDGTVSVKASDLFTSDRIAEEIVSCINQSSTFRCTGYYRSRPNRFGRLSSHSGTRFHIVRR